LSTSHNDIENPRRDPDGNVGRRSGQFVCPWPITRDEAGGTQTNAGRGDQQCRSLADHFLPAHCLPPHRRQHSVTVAPPLRELPLVPQMPCAGGSR
jgi:hypothetical protein